MRPLDGGSVSGCLREGGRLCERDGGSGWRVSGTSGGWGADVAEVAPSDEEESWLPAPPLMIIYFPGKAWSELKWLCSKVRSHFSHSWWAVRGTAGSLKVRG